MSLSSFLCNFYKSALPKVTLPANMLPKLDCFILLFNEKVILTAVTFKTHEQKASYSRKEKATCD